jgi:hypothetical protein
MGFVNFAYLSADQQDEARLRRPKWHPSEFPRFKFWVRADGHVSEKPGHHQLTAAEIKRMMTELGEPLDPPGKGSLREWKPGVTFSLDAPPKDAP